MNSYFMFKGKNSFDMGIIITKMPTIQKPERRMKKIIIPGRNGNLYKDEGTYESIVFQLECSIIEECEISEIKKWLDGEGELILSSSPDRFYKANIMNKIDFTSIVNKIHEFPLEFEVQPIAYSIEEKEINITKQTEINITNSTYIIKPYMKIFGSGDMNLKFNSRNIIFKGIENYIELDCESEEAFKDIENCNNKIFSDDFPYFELGKNIISWEGNITNILIKYREAYL